jgi:hypothetical protein
MRIARYGNIRYWAIYDGAGALVCICLYKKGAEEVVRRLSNRSRMPRKTYGHPRDTRMAAAYDKTRSREG